MKKETNGEAHGKLIEKLLNGGEYWRLVINVRREEKMEATVAFRA